MSDENITIPILKVDEVNANGRRYPEGVVEKAIEKAMAKGFFPVTLKPRDKPVLKDVAGEVKKMEIKDGNVVAEIHVLPTPDGKLLAELLEIGAAKFSPVGMGTTVDGEIQDGYEMTHVAVTPNDDD